PAFPAMRRTTLDGRHLLDGRPIDRTEFARDPKAPVSESHIVRLLAAQSRRRAAPLPLPLLRPGDHGVSRPAAGPAAPPGGLPVCHAETDAGRQRAARVIACARQRTLWVGSAGLAEPLPDALGLGPPPPATTPYPAPGTRHPAPDTHHPPANRPVLLVSGSAS